MMAKTSPQKIIYYTPNSIQKRADTVTDYFERWKRD